MRTALLLFLCILTLGTTAQAQSCFEQEVDPSTRRRYQSEAQWQADVEKLEQSAPPRPGYYTLYVAYQLYKSEVANTKVLRSDKRAHCYIGCRIANDVGHEAAEFAAWYKENQDLTDCNPRSLFEWRDIVATQVGIRIALEQPGQGDKAFCQDRCRRQVSR